MGKNGFIIGIGAIILLSVVAYFVLSIRQPVMPKSTDTDTQQSNNEDSSTSTIMKTPTGVMNGNPPAADKKQIEQYMDQYAPQEIPEEN